MFRLLKKNSLRCVLPVIPIYTYKSNCESKNSSWFYNNKTKSKANTNSDNVYRILIFGETGSGKSTLINTLTNYLENGTLENLKVSIPTMYLKSTQGYADSEFDVKNSGKSQTKQPMEYMFSSNGSKICILDTPGLCDTEGLEKDDENLNKIVNAAIKMEKLSGIVLVINGSNSRLNNNIKRVLNTFNSFFPDSIMKNIIVVFTCCREETCNFKCLDELGIKPHKIIYMNNSAFSIDPKKFNASTNVMTQMEWEQSMSVSKNIIDEIKKLDSSSTYEFEQMQKIRNSIKSKIHDTKMKITELQNIQDEYITAKNNADINNKTAEQFKNFTVKKQVTKEVFYETPYHSTICGNCNKVCHSMCGLDEIKGDDKNPFSGCAAFNGSSICNNCGCGVSTHYHDHKDSKIETVTLEQEIKELKDKYLNAAKQYNEDVSQMKEHELVIKGIELMIDEIKDSITADIKDLKKICKNYNLVNEFSDAVIQLEHEKLLLKTVESQKTAQEFIDLLKYLINHFSSL